MKPLDELSKDPIIDCAGQIMETVNQLARLMRREMRRQRPDDISQSQFRAMRILQHHVGASLSQLAAHIDLTLASTSKLIDVLAKHSLVERCASPLDRRKVELYLTEHGRDTLDQVEAARQRALLKVLQALPAEHLEMVQHSMQIIHTAISECNDSAANK